MSESKPSSPRQLISLLRDMEERGGTGFEGLPERDEAYTLWDGIVFNLLSQAFVAQLNDIKEILNLPSSITRVPGTRGWMLGIANIRGNLLPICDLQMFLGGKPVVFSKRSRVLVIDHEGVRVGLLVAGVQGIRHFKPDQRVVDHALPEDLAKYSTEAYRVAAETWPVFDVRLLARDPEFQMASA